MLLFAGFGVVLPARTPQFSSDVAIVEVYATVTDSGGNPVLGLTQDDFVIEEDGARQSISAFTWGEFPLALAVGVDRSFSVSRADLAGTTSAVASLLRGLRPDDQSMVLAIGSETEVLAPLSTERGAALGALGRMQPWGTTPLYDAIVEAVRLIQPATGRRALIVISDGVDRYSTISATEILKQARENDVLIYPIALGRRRPPIFAEMAAASGGRSLHAPDSKGLTATLSTVAGELRTQYLLGYTPLISQEQRPGWRSIRVEVKSRPDSRVRARDGYVAR